LISQFFYVIYFEYENNNFKYFLNIYNNNHFLGVVWLNVKMMYVMIGFHGMFFYDIFMQIFIFLLMDYSNNITIFLS